MSTTVVSIGYERRSVEEMVQILTDNRVRVVIDIRQLPLSRRKGFSKRALADRLSGAGIEYRHIRSAGNPYRHLKAQTRRCLALYASYISRHPEAVKLVKDEMTKPTVAVLCYERLHDDCHRSVLLSALRRRTRRVKVKRVE